MSRKQGSARMAAIGGLIAMIAVLGGQRCACADELSDLRANNELLQQRLDQIQQATGDPGAPPGTPLKDGSFPRSFLIPGTDTSVRVGGSVTGIVQYSRP
jgi:hypothetical protein